VVHELRLYLNWVNGAGLPDGGLYALPVDVALTLFALQAEDTQ
jgi:hypothetical protein